MSPTGLVVESGQPSLHTTTLTADDFVFYRSSRFERMDAPENSDETRIIEQNPGLYQTILHRARIPGDWVDAEDILNRS